MLPTVNTSAALIPGRAIAVFLFQAASRKLQATSVKLQALEFFVNRFKPQAADVKDRRLFTLDEMKELDELENIFAKELTQSGEQALENEMNRVLNQYDKSMFIKDSQGMVDVSNPANAEKMALLLKRDHPEIYNKIFKLTEDINQKQVLDEFDITGREPNANGGRIGYAKGGLSYLMGE